MLNIIFIGAPGVGKGTQSAFIKKDYSIAHISTGDMFRENISNNTELGKTAKSYIDRGELVPDSLVIDMIVDRIKKDDCKKGFMLDGFPRTMEQAVALDRILSELKFGISVVINLYANKETIVSRLLSRGRDDDNEETIKTRIEVFEHQSKPVLYYYRNSVKVVDIESVGSPDEVYSKIKSELNSISDV